MSKRKIVFLGIVSLVAFFILNKSAYVFINNPINNDFSNSLTAEFKENTFTMYFSKNELISGFIGFVGVWLIFLYKLYDRKNFLEKKEHGSAKWGEIKDIKPLIDSAEEQNILLTQTEKMSLDTRKTRKNNNVLVIGGSGSGKTRSFVKPNIMQMHSSFVITDPKGELLKATGKMLQDNGYIVKVFNLIDLASSDKYNMFNYIKDEKDILKITNNIIVNTNSPNSKNAGDFWEKAESALLEALISYVFFEGLEEEKNIGTVMELLRLADVKEDDEEYQSPLDILFNDLKKENPNHFASKQYDIYKLAAGKTAKSILVSVGVRLAPFNIQDVINLTSKDTLELEKIGDRKTALFIIIPDSDVTLNFITAIMYQQLFDILFYRADNIYNGRLPYKVRFLLDEMANIGQIPSLEIYIATMRSREISVNIILQNLTQLKNLYKNTWETITGNCDTILFLGGKEQSTLRYISETIGKTTIDYRSISETRGTNGSYSISNQIIARDLITPEEVGLIKADECILTIRGLNPFISEKYNLEKHKNYYQTLDANSSNNYLKKMTDETQSILKELEETKDIQELELIENI